MKVRHPHRTILRMLRTSDTELGNKFNIAWHAIFKDDTVGPLERYEAVMDIKSPLMDQVRAHLIAELLIA